MTRFELSRAAAFATALVLCGALIASAQQPAAAPAAGTPAAPAAATAADTQKAVEAVRKDMRAARANIVAKNMELDAAGAAAFWPVYKQYEADYVKLGDEQLAIIKDYAAAWNASSLTDAKAKELIDRSIAVDDKIRALQTHYLGEMSKVLPAKTVARFYQVQNRLNALQTLSVAQEIPLVY
jgi:pyruvate/2-oxoglutarate dehydrogenase complex dihydrolipoamide acyltransferase (E2) component